MLRKKNEFRRADTDVVIKQKKAQQIALKYRNAQE